MKMILIIEDDAFQRHFASRVCASRSGIFIPNTPDEVDSLHAEDYGLVIVDRHMPPAWSDARTRLLDRLMPDCEVVEMTCAIAADMSGHVERASRIVNKTGTCRELEEMVNEYIRFGTVLEKQVC